MSVRGIYETHSRWFRTDALQIAAYEQFVDSYPFIRPRRSLANVARPSVGIEQDARRTLLGRGRECEAVDRLLAAARDSQGQTIVVYGEPGIGKTALLGYATAGAQGFQVLRAVGNEAEMAVPFAALQQFCSPCLASVEQLSKPQRDALQVAFGLVTGVAPVALKFP